MSFLALIAPLSKNLRPLLITSYSLKHITVRCLASTDKIVNEKQDQLKRISPLPAKKRVIVFDIDDTLCHPLGEWGYTPEVEKLIRDNHSECPIIQWTRYTHVFLPHLQFLFGYLLTHGARIAFFSSAVKERNEFVIPELLTSFWGTEKYNVLREKGQFSIHSRDEMRKGERKHCESREGNYVKDLKAVIRDGESLSDIILVDDDRSYVAYDQYPFLRTIDLLSWRFQTNYFYGDCKNSTYYLLGLFKTAFEHEKYKELALKEAFKLIVPENYSPNEKWYYAAVMDSFKRNMIDMGLSEVKKQVPDARLFGRPLTSEEESNFA